MTLPHSLSSGGHLHPGWALRSRAASALITLGVLLAGCGAPKLNPTLINPPEELTIPYRVHPGDTLSVKFKYHPDDDSQVTVDTDGKLSLPVTGPMSVGGLLIPQVEKMIAERSARYLRNPVVTVAITESQARAFICGEVNDQGYVTINRPTTVLQAVVERGGFMPSADLSKVIVLSYAAGTQRARAIDLKAEVSGEPQDRTLLEADEVVFVPKTGIAKANEAVEQYVNRMTPLIITRMIRFDAISAF
jgi:protein involved in polysaccharide export with SLBB domain